MDYLDELLLKDTLSTLDRQIDLKIGINSRYDQGDVFNLILMSAINTTSAESIVTELKNVNKRNDIPSADVVSYHIGKQNYIELYRQLEQVVNSSYQLAVRRRLFGKYAAVAIDIHEIPYYGEINNPLIMGCKHNNGTSYCYKYATIDIVEKNQRFTLKAIPLTPLSNNNEDTVKELLEHAMKYIHIKYVLLDRGFFSVEVIKVLLALNLKFIMPATKNDKIKLVIKDNLNKKAYFLKDFPMGLKKNQVTFNLAVKYHEEDKKYHPFATNFEIKDKEDVYCIAELYRKRWGIETGYRVKKDFMAKTTSQRYTIRMVYFMISVILYNFWLLCNLIYCREHGIELGTPKITTRILKLYIKMYIIDSMNESLKVLSSVNQNSVSYRVFY